MTRIINLISSPRNISTALMYSFAQREDTKVIDEPFYGYYLTISKTKHPGQQQIIAAMETDPEKIVRNIVEMQEKPIVFLKNMAHHLIEMDLSFLPKMINLFLIRDPKRLIRSFAKVIANPGPDDIGVRRQYDLFQSLQPQNPQVLDSGELLKDPAGVLQQLCNRLNIPFDKKMLSWKAGPIKEDGIWARHWYKNVHATQGFQKPDNRDVTLPAHCIKLYQTSKKYYDHMYHYSIKA